MSDTPHVSMREIAQAAGVSVSAVSLALKNSTKISAARRETIVALAERMGYRRDPRLTELMEHLRTARPHRSNSTIAMLIPELTREQLKDYPPMQGLIEGVREIAALAGFNVTLFFLSDPGIGTRRIRSILLARNIKGVVIAPFPQWRGADRFRLLRSVRGDRRLQHRRTPAAPGLPELPADDG
jgi:LacI family transcriptional regulator